MEGFAIKRVLDDYVGNFIDSLDLGRDEASIRIAAEKLAANSGFERYAYVEGRASDRRGYSNYSLEWQERYISQNYFLLDPVAVHAARTMRPVAWSYSTRNESDAVIRQFFGEAKDFGVSSGLALPIRGSFGSTVLLSFAADSVEFPDVAIRDFAYVATAVAYLHISMREFASVVPAATSTELSPREQICVMWASLGKTKAETAQLLGITEKTVRFYLERAREKLGASNISHAVRIALLRGLLD
ncbi:helix-turn-helix transcriptional regulator [Aquamicrobium terrae]|uniref:DNA-binding CsgD family transcriptional regulator n=1 Tax=Aquamicrobium terrae TaxID=1324945 RepID=A0ABV2N3V2_9HYPH